ncbi:MAG: Lrp/AsnC ligand binding domain-containing protein [Pseudomonadota bacterium]
MVTAFILLRAKRGSVKTLAENLASRQGIAEVYSVSGNFDLIAIARVKDNDALADLVTTDLADIDDITHSETMLAFRAFSRHDLQSMFSIGQS